MTPPRPLWGWTAPVRILLTVVAGGLSLGLLSASRPGPGRSAPVPDLVVDPNTAPAAVLMALPRLGPVLVGRIVAGRREAPFTSLDDLDARVRGIGPVTIAALRPHLRIGPGTDAPGGPADGLPDPRKRPPTAP